MQIEGLDAGCGERHVTAPVPSIYTRLATGVNSSVLTSTATCFLVRLQGARADILRLTVSGTVRCGNNSYPVLCLDGHGAPVGQCRSRSFPPACGIVRAIYNSLRK